ncbi:MAG: DNA polymerase III subunit gamma/tau [Rhizobiales bacterium]|nr:DNA polymerase III subunit gamma/tau [Hyphomicrobiales bacterium]
MNDVPDRSDEPGFDLGPAPATPGGAYRVLARKYRPATFDDLIGQDAMVRTLTNAFESGRIPQAWILTGVRGVGKTTTARILARALNYTLPDGSGAPTIRMPGLGVHCRAIMDSRHLDVIEMDAASHNGVDDVRQINEAIRYAPVSARYKIYILDEVHMLSPQAFNALLKTLEEPPPHAKFIFATTDIRKVPVTVLSRCQRFDLRRVEASRLVKHLEGIAAKEHVTAEPEALALLARAAEGSVRDSLSLFDQAIAHAAGPVRAADVRQMLGLADRTRVIDLFEALMRGDVAAALIELRDQYESGADPAVALADLAEFTHFVTRVKIVPAVADDVSLTEAERTRGRDFAATLSMRVLARTWQMLLKGIPEVKEAARPVAAAEMVLVRIAHAADLPTPDDVIRSLDAAPRTEAASTQGAGASAVGEGSQGASARSDPPRAMARTVAMPSRVESATPAARAQPSRVLEKFADIVALAAEKRDLTVKTALERDLRLVRMEDGRLEIALDPGASRGIVQDLSRKLSDWTGKRWMVVVSADEGAPTLKAQADARQTELEVGVRGDPLVQAVLNRFPGAQIVGVRGPAGNVANGEAEPPAVEPVEDANDEN